MWFKKEPHEAYDHEYGVVEEFKDKDGAKNKNIVISFDGTGGSPEWAIQKKPDETQKNPDEPKKTHETSYKSIGGLSNVCKMHLYAGGNVGNSTASCPGQVSISEIFFARTCF